MEHNMKVSVIAAAALCILSATACDNSQYSLENLYPEEYHKIISFQEDAVNTDVMKIYDVNIDITETLTVLRGGSDPSLKAIARLRPMTDEEADIYLTEGVALDPQYYSIPTPEIVLEPEERYKDVVITFSAKDIAGIRHAMEAAPETSFYIALMLDGLDGTGVNAGKSYLVRKIELGKPVISLSGTTVSDNADSWVIELSAAMDGNNLWDFNCTPRRDDSYIENYNYSLGRDYSALPEEMKYSFSGNLNFVKGENSSQNKATLTVYKDGFDLDNSPYVLPVAIDMENMDFEMTPYYMVLNGVINLTEDMLECPFDLNGIDGNGLAGLIDGDMYNTFWHTPYPDSGKEYEDEKFGHYFQVNLSRGITQMKCEYYNRPATNEHIAPNYAKTVEIYKSSDGKIWDLLGERTNIPEDESPVIIGTFESDTQFSYIRFCVKETQQGLKPGVDPGACTHIAEFKLYGI